nr:ribonuclease H-like domain-containing protein [Tanacetum cinerariifolium]
MSSIEAGYIAALEAAMESIWMRKFIDGLGVIPTNNEPMKMLCDNTGAIIIANKLNITKGCEECFSSWSFMRDSLYAHSFVDLHHPNYVCHLQRSLYGLKQAPHAWFQRFASYATRFGFRHSKTNLSLFIFHHGTYITYLLLYVDDIILTTSSTAFYRELSPRFIENFLTLVDIDSKVGLDGDPVLDPTLYHSLVSAL